MTETGWATEGEGSISERDQAGLLLSLYFANFRQHWRNTFVYMLRDDPVQGYWGLVDTDYQPKTSGLALHNVTKILRTPPPPNSPQLPVEYSISGETGTSHHMLLRDPNHNALIVWNEQAAGSTNPSNSVIRTDPSASTTH